MSLFPIIFGFEIMFCRNPWFHLSKTKVCAGIASCVMKAKKWPISILAVRQVILGLSCESGVVFRGGTQRAFEWGLHMIFCGQKQPFS